MATKIEALSGRRAIYFQGFGEGSFIFLDLGLKHNFLTFWGFREQGERSFSFREQRPQGVGGGGGSRFFFFFWCL